MGKSGLLKSCPFCTAEDKDLMISKTRGQFYGSSKMLIDRSWITCMKCGATGPLIVRDKIENIKGKRINMIGRAKSAWNRGGL